MTEERNINVVEGDVFDLLSDLPEDYAHCAVVDYPWEFDQRGGTGRFGYEEPGDTFYNLEPSERLDTLFQELSRVLVDGAWIICMSDDEFQDDIRNSLRESPFTFRRNWCWSPLDMGMGTYGRVNHYPIPTATNGETERYVKDRGTLFEVSGGRNTDYPTGKPTELYRQILESPVIRDDEILLEPFCGSGPGAQAAYERGLGYWGADVSPEAVRETEDSLSMGTKSLLEI